MTNHTQNSNQNSSDGSIVPVSQSDMALPWWRWSDQVAPVNEDFTTRVVSLSADALWRPTQASGVDLRILEYLPGSTPRLTGQLRLDPAASPAQLGENSNIEILMQRGELETQMGIYPSGLYIRLPASGDASQKQLIMRADQTQAVNSSGLLYFAAGQMMSSDFEQRRLDTNDESRWLPGPADGIQVLPLHGHGTGNAMLIRWKATIAFKPRLDPKGEELLVLEGSVHDHHGHYPAGSWIRNPIDAWQSWGAKSGTVVYYKNGHFTTATEHS